MLALEVEIENVYPDGTVKTYGKTEVPEPEPDEDLDEWAYECIFPLTGTGQTDGDACYFATIVKASDPAWVGRQFEFGL